MLFLEKLEKIIFNEKIKSSSDIESDISLKTIAEIPLKENKNITTELISYESEKMPISKAFKKLRTNIQFLCVNNTLDKKVMLVTSPREEEGKSYVAANLAVSFAEIGKKVLIIDSDMLNGRQDKIFNIPNNLGLSNYLSNLDTNGVEINEFLSKFINETAIKNVNLITSGTVPPNPAELLASPKLQELIKDAKVFFDIIIIDAEEVLGKTEALILARNVNSTILVATNKKTKIEDLENSKKDIQNIGGKIIGVVLNKVKLKKEKKTKAQRKDEFNKFKLRIKEKINITIENIKRKIQESNQKLLEEAKKEEKIVEEITEKKVEIPTIQVVEENEKISKNEIKENDVISEKIKQEDSEKDEKISLLKKIKNYRQVDKKEIENNETNNVIEKTEKEDIEVNQLSMFQEIPIEELDKKENKEEKETRFSKIKESFKENALKVKEISTEKFGNFKSIVSEKIEIIKEKTKNFYVKAKDTCVKKYNDIKNKNEKVENVTSEIIEKTEPEELKSEEIKQEEVIEENIASEKEIINDETIENEKMVLVVVDAEKGYCRVFSKEYFTEKLIRGVDKTDNLSRAHYSSKELKFKQEYFIDKYQLTIAQAQRIDPLIYSTLNDYDRYLWEARNISSNKAEKYALSMAKDFEMQSDENEKDHLVKSQRLRKTELENAELEIIYKLENLWRTNKINLFDKIQLNKFAKIYEIENSMKNDAEIMRSENSKKFYVDVIEGAEKRLENANEAERLKEENEKLAIEEDRKIKQEELKLEQQQFEIEKRAAQERIKIEQENVRAEKKAEQERLKEEKRKEKEIERIERKEENLRRKKEKQKQKEEAKLQKEIEKAKLREEAKLEEELMVDNLYPKTKHNKNL